MYLGEILFASTVVAVSVSVETEGQMSLPLLQGRQLDPFKALLFGLGLLLKIKVLLCLMNVQYKTGAGLKL